MNLFENPIFITHRRLVHRGGMLAAVLIAALIGFCLLIGLLEDLHVGIARFGYPEQAGRTFYGWTIALEILVAVVGGFSRISRTMADDGKAGLWESNRLTPLKPSQLLAGYWFGPPLREFYMALVLAVFGLPIVLCSGLPFTLWLGTQMLILSTALFFGLLGVLSGMAFQRSQGMLIFLPLVLAIPFSATAPSRLLTNFLMPTYGIVNFFLNRSPHQYGSDWWNLPTVFGVHIQPVLLTLGLQFIVAIFVWRVLVRKTTSPFQPLVLPWEAFALFTFLAVSQHALLWDVWSGRFPTVFHSERSQFDGPMLLSFVHCGTILVGLLLLGFASPSPEHVRLESLRLGFKNFGAFFSRSAVSLALALAALAGAAMSVHFVFSWRESSSVCLVTGINLAEIFLIFSLVLEYCRLRYKRRALGFVALWLVGLCIVPVILAGASSNETFARISLLAPGFIALSDENNQDWFQLFSVLFAYFGIVMLLFIGWLREWRKLLAKKS